MWTIIGHLVSFIIIIWGGADIAEKMVKYYKWYNGNTINKKGDLDHHRSENLL